MATTELDVDAIEAATGWAGATVANLSTSNDVRATGGAPAEFIRATLESSPGDFGSQNSIQFRAEGRIDGIPGRAKSFRFELLDGTDSDAVLETVDTVNQLSQTDQNVFGPVWSRSDSQTVIDAYKFRLTMIEGGGMPDSVLGEVDRMWSVLDYNVAGAGPPAGLRTLGLTGAGV